MPYVLLIFFYLVPGHLNHVDSVRFDNQGACLAAARAIDLAAVGGQGIVQLCVSAATGLP